MRTETERSDKFAAKCVGNDIKNKIDAHASSQRAHFAQGIGRQVEIEIMVKQIVAGRIKPVHRPYYIEFAKSLNFLRKKFRGQIFYNEMILLENKWIDRGLDFMVLDDLKRLFWASYPQTKIFILDSSLLDGVDGLG
ncbi:MAG: hypothetical protein WC475_01700 [Candidatus Paceibacterota bacterium]|jgi:hypothetical protein